VRPLTQALRAHGARVQQQLQRNTATRGGGELGAGDEGGGGGQKTLDGRGEVLGVGWGGRLREASRLR